MSAPQDQCDQRASLLEEKDYHLGLQVQQALREPNPLLNEASLGLGSLVWLGGSQRERTL